MASSNPQNGDAPKIFARKSAPPPPSDEEEMAEETSPPPLSGSTHVPDPPLSNDPLPDQDDDFLMDISDPYPLDSSGSDNPRPTVSFSSKKSPLQPANRVQQAEGRKKGQRRGTKGKGKENSATSGTSEPPLPRGNGGDSGSTTDPPAPEAPAPDVDELLASLEATVQGKSSLPPIPSAAASAASVSPGVQAPSATGGTPSSATPPLPPPKDPQPPPPPPPGKSPSSKELAGANNRSSATPQESSRGKRKPRSTRQQRQKRAASSSCQRTVPFSSENADTGSSSVTPPSSSSSATPANGRNAGKKGQNSSIPAPSRSSSADNFPSHNRTWTAGVSSEAGGRTDHQNPQIGTMTIPKISGYDRKPNSGTPCRDVTSPRFLPDDEEKADLVIQKIMGEDGPQRARANPLMTPHNLPTIFSSDVTEVPLDKAPGAQTEWDSENFLTVSELPSRWESDPRLHPIPRKEAVSFLLISRPRHTRRRWEIPNPDISADFINDSICTMFGDDYPYAEAYDKTGKWGIFSSILLKSSDPVAIEEFRKHLARFSFKDMDFDTFPKDLVTARPDISILLRNNMKFFALEVLPKVLFLRNKNKLAGSLRVLSTTRFPEGEKSQKGESKENWRQIHLKGDDQLMRCLRFLPESTPFLLGVEPVQIKGGLRPQEADSLLGKRHWSGSPASSAPVNIFAPVSRPANPTASSSDSRRGSFSKRGRGGKRGFFSKKSQ